MPARAAFNGNITVKLLLRYNTRDLMGKAVARYQRMKIYMRVQRSLNIQIETSPSLINPKKTLLKFQANPCMMPANTPPDLVPSNYIKSIFIKQISIKSDCDLSIKRHRNQFNDA